MNAHKTGMSLALLFGLFGLIWEIIIAIGSAQGYLTWKLSLISLNNPFTVSAFNLGTAIELIVLMLIGGYLIGAIFALISKKVHK